uniref:Putative secreted protein n=1 Tax=Anopheles triannulatus TaxID=58253 RepID=A0A2M4B1T7_9DIPT
MVIITIIIIITMATWRTNGVPIAGPTRKAKNRSKSCSTMRCVAKAWDVYRSSEPAGVSTPARQRAPRPVLWPVVALRTVRPAVISRSYTGSYHRMRPSRTKRTPLSTAGHRPVNGRRSNRIRSFLPPSDWPPKRAISNSERSDSRNKPPCRRAPPRRRIRTTMTTRTMRLSARVRSSRVSPVRAAQRTRRRAGL